MRGNILDPRIASTTRQFLSIGRVGKDPLRVRSRVFFIGIVAKTILLLFCVRWRRHGLLSVVLACELVFHSHVFFAAWVSTGPSWNVKSASFTQYFLLLPVDRCGYDLVPSEGCSGQDRPERLVAPA